MMTYEDCLKVHREAVALHEAVKITLASCQRTHQKALQARDEALRVLKEIQG
jgi:hypothetical protein